ncbi:MAG: 2OG-Fe(II) oxygenase [Bacteroidetes bacterium]|nr:2OG-Fe(II) oxygenase [Bacteroidota bacterium]
MFTIKQLIGKFLTKKASTTTSPEIAISASTNEPYVQKFTTEPYNFKTITVDELFQQDAALWDLYTNEKDGFLIKNFLSEEEVDKIMENFNKALNDNPAHTSVGFTYPPIFAEFSSKLRNASNEEKEIEVKKYFEKTGHFNDNFSNMYNVDVRTRMEKLFRGIAGGREINVAETADGKGNYPFATFRYLLPDKGLMTVHCGNYFGKTFGEFYKDLAQKVAVKNQMSYFIMLNEPEQGGELTLFNFRWKDGQTKVDNMEDNEIIQPDGSKMYVEDNPNIIKDKIKPKKGDMILFQGGNIWHRVETVRGSKPRITLGGFIGVSIDKTKIYYWS